MANILHSKATPEHGTPPEYVELARYALGSIDLDPGSSSYWNHYLVKAATFYDAQRDGLALPWSGRVWCNPPGGENHLGGLVRQFWQKLVEAWLSGQVHSAVWMGYSLEQLIVLQGCAVHPLQFVNAFPPARIGFMTRAPANAAPERSKNPTHGNYITLLQTRTNPTVAREQLQRFVERASSLAPGMGCAIVRPV